MRPSLFGNSFADGFFSVINCWGIHHYKLRCQITFHCDVDRQNANAAWLGPQLCILGMIERFCCAWCCMGEVSPWVTHTIAEVSRKARMVLRRAGRGMRGVLAKSLQNQASKIFRLSFSKIFWSPKPRIIEKHIHGSVQLLSKKNRTLHRIYVVCWSAADLCRWVSWQSLASKTLNSWAMALHAEDVHRKTSTVVSPCETTSVPGAPGWGQVKDCHFHFWMWPLWRSAAAILCCEGPWRRKSFVARQRVSHARRDE